MSEPGQEGDQELNVGRPGRPEDATPGGPTQGISQLGERGAMSGGAAGTGETETDAEIEPEPEPEEGPTAA